MFCRKVIILEVVGFLEGLVEHLLLRGTHAWLLARALNLGQLRDGGVHRRQELLRPYAHLFQHRNDNAFLILEQRRHQMQRQHLGVAIFRGMARRSLNRLLRFHGQLVPLDCHLFTLLKTELYSRWMHRKSSGFTNMSHLRSDLRHRKTAPEPLKSAPKTPKWASPSGPAQVIHSFE